MAETAEALLVKVKEVFRRNAAKIKLKKSTYEAANEYAQSLGECLSDAFSSVLKEDVLPDGKLYRATADAVIRPMLEEAYKSIAAAAKSVQDVVNAAAGVSLKAVEPMTPAEKNTNITYVVNNACRSSDYNTEMNALANETQQFSRKIVDGSARKNAEFQYRAGMQPLVTRVYDGRGLRNGRQPCAWCMARVGKDVPYNEAYARGMFERHPGCGCVITYKSSKGTYTQGRGQWQNNSWSELDAAAREERVRFSEEDSNPNKKMLLLARQGNIFVSRSDDLSKYAQKIPKLKDYTDIVCHGDQYSFEFRDMNGKATNVSVKELGDIIEKAGFYKSGKIRLISCRAAAEPAVPARYFAKRFNVDVLAPTEVVNVDFDGNMILADDDRNAKMGIETGKWVTVKPTGEII